MEIKKFYAAGRAIIAQPEIGDSYIVCVMEFNDTKPGQSYTNALDNAVLIADLLNEKYSSKTEKEKPC